MVVEPPRFVSEALELPPGPRITPAAADRAERAATRDEEVGPGQGLRPGEVLQGGGEPLDLAPIAKVKRRVDRLRIEAQMVVADSALAK